MHQYIEFIKVAPKKTDPIGNKKLKVENLIFTIFNCFWRSFGHFGLHQANFRLNIVEIVENKIIEFAKSKITLNSFYRE